MLRHEEDEEEEEEAATGAGERGRERDFKCVEKEGKSWKKHAMCFSLQGNSTIQSHLLSQSVVWLCAEHLLLKRFYHNCTLKYDNMRWLRLKYEQMD